MKKFGNVLWGIVLIIIGLIIGGNALGITNINIFFDGWWTLFIIVPCFTIFLLLLLLPIAMYTGFKFIGIIGLLIGIALLLGCQDILDFDLIWKLAFPAILVIVGISMIFKDAIGSKVNEEIKKLNKDRNNISECCATFSSQNVKIENEKFTGADITAIFGGVKYDLKNAIIDSDVVINASCTFGGIEIYVPSNVKIKIKSTSIFGGVENKSNTQVDENSHTIYINGTALFGGVDIK